MGDNLIKITYQDAYKYRLRTCIKPVLSIPGVLNYCKDMVQNLRAVAG